MRTRRLRSGYSDLGTLQIPPHAPAIVLTDRDTGTQYLISWNTTGVQRLSLNTVFTSIQKREGVRIYASNDGPYMDEDGQYKIIVRGGRIGYEYTEYPRAITDQDQAPPYARQTNAEEKLSIDKSNPNPLLVHIGLKT